MKNIYLILMIYLLCVSCIDIITSSEDDFYESVHMQGSGWIELYQNTENQNLVLTNNFTFQLWFSGQEQISNEANCIVSLKGNTSNISIYRNPNVNNMLMIYQDDQLAYQENLSYIDFSQENNFYLLSIIKNENEISIYINENIVMSTTVNDESMQMIIGGTLNNNNPKNLWHGYIDEIRLWDSALHDTVINFHNQYPTKLSSSYNDDYLQDLNGLWDFKISMSETSINNLFHDVNESDSLRYAIVYTLESTINELSELGR